eukprot:GILI01018742.1.p1 GENE.GILI01018742.1~~GILI01018742.1.p1  ORF type:complete len:137 (-),score=36.36 GILI01018742.1:139-549(-)
MSKLRSKLKVTQKRKSRREGVAKRKLERIQKEQEEKSAASEEQRIEAEVDDIIRRDAEGITEEEEKTVKMVAGLVVHRPALAQSKKKQLSRKQLVRQEKHRERGEAIASAQEKKWADKKQRVKHRAQVRNSELGNE